MEYRSFGDIPKLRQSIYNYVKDGFEKRPPIEGKYVKIRFKDVEVKHKDLTPSDYKKAKLNDLDLTVPVKGTIELLTKDGKKLQSRRLTLGHLPYIIDRFGTFIGNGTDFSVSNQQRLLPGIYTRKKNNGEVEAQFNVAGKIGFRISIDPSTGVFKLNIGNNKLPLYPILNNLHIPDSMLEKMWGKAVLEKNKSNDPHALERLYKKLAGYDFKKDLTIDEIRQQVLKLLDDLKLDPKVTKSTLNKEFDKVTPISILDASGKVLKVFQGKEKPDDRDSLIYKSFHGVEDFIKERIDKDSGNIGKRLAYKLDKSKDLSKVPASYFSPYLKSIIKGDSRALPIEEVNPLDAYDSLHKNIVLGEGGIGSTEMVTMEARNINPSQFLFIDPVRGPESEKVGIDTRTALNTFKGSDKKLYTRVINTKTNKEELVSADKIFNSYVGIGMPKKNKVKAMYKGEIVTVTKNKLDYFAESPDEIFSIYSNFVPFMSAVQGNRLFMAGKEMSDTMPLIYRESPIVRNLKEIKFLNDKEDNSKDYETYYGKKILSLISPVDGKVKKITDNQIEILPKSGKKIKLEMFRNYPLANKTRFHQYPVVKEGDKIKKGQVLASSNFADNNGTMAIGKHLNASYLPFRGLTFEDAIVISDSASKKLTSENIYKFELPIDKNTHVGRNIYIANFPSLYNKDILDKIDKNGIIKVGQKVKKGDPLILGLKTKELTATELNLGKLHKLLRSKYDDASVDWDKEDIGKVIGVVNTGKKIKVYVKTKSPAQIGDKLAGRFANKGVISAIIPDNEMPVIKRTGEPLELILNPMGIISRINPAQIFSGLLGKIGKEKGKIYRVPHFTDEKISDWVRKELKKNNIPDTEELYDPKYNKTIKAITTYPYFYKFSKLAENIISGREISSYTSNMQPVKGRVENKPGVVQYTSSLVPLLSKAKGGSAIKVGADLITHFLSHGARHNLRDITLIKGQKNDEFWKALRLGYIPPSPDAPYVYKKFEAMLKASGANVEKKGDMINIFPVTDSDITKLSTGEIKNPKFIKAKDMSPEKGGFFDFGLTGGPVGEKWAHLSLPEPFPNPLMEDSLAQILDLSKKDFENILYGKQKLNGLTGGKAIHEALKKIDIDKSIDKLKKEIPNLSKVYKDKAIKKMKYLIGIRNSGRHPSEMMLTKFPVIPPVFRPISMVGNELAIIDDANKLYRDAFYANDILKTLKKEKVSDEELAEERKNLYNSLKGVAGLTEPISIKNKQSKVKGFIKKIIGEQPKTGFFFDKLVSKTQDLSGRGVAIPDPSLNMDELGLPEKLAWQLYKPFIIRELSKKRGIPVLVANEMVEKKDPLAKQALEGVLQDRPILMNRAPSLHRFSIMAFVPKIVKHNAIATSPVITDPYNLDYDGDALQLFVPASEHAAIEAKNKMMPTKNLFSLKDYGVHYLPPYEVTYGLYTGTKKKLNNKSIKFKSVEEMKEALKNGKIDYHSVVEVK